MSDELKPKYESPVAVSLGERYVGSGGCTVPGSGDATGCAPGNAAAGTCLADGNAAESSCSSGFDFVPPPNCTDGPMPLPGVCSAGSSFL